MARITIRYEADDVVIERGTEVSIGNPRFHSKSAQFVADRLLPQVLDMIDAAYGVTDPVRKEGDAA